MEAAAGLSPFLFPSHGSDGCGKSPSTWPPPWQCSPFPGSCRGWRWRGMEVVDGEYPLEGGETLSGGREGGGLFGGRRDRKC